MEKAHHFEVGDVLAHFNVRPEDGLTNKQVEEYRKLHGRNELPPDEGTPFWQLVLKQFDDLLVKILLGAAIVSFLLACFEEGEHWGTAFLEPIVIFAILIANATVGVMQETNAEKAIEALKEYEPETAVVIREGKHVSIAAAELVPGDIVEVAVGDRIPCDIRLVRIFSSTIRTDQALLTGESVSVMKQTEKVETKDAVNQDKKNILFSGTTVSIGKAQGVAVLTGQKTEMGKIHKTMTESEDVETPLKKKLDEFGELLSKVIAVICVCVWLVNINHFNDPSHGSWYGGAVYYFKIAVALAVAAIPEGLPAVVTTCLALGTAKMAKKNAIVRSLPSVETLGCCTVICSDKTGTLTTNKMQVSKVLVVEDGGKLKEFNVTGSGWDPAGVVTAGSNNKTVANPVADSEAVLWTARICSLCNDSRIVFADGKFDRQGEATEAALRVLVEKLGVNDGSRWTEISGGSCPPQERAQACNNHWEAAYRKTTTFEFTRDRKSMSVICEDASSAPTPSSPKKGKKAAAASASSGSSILFVKGAPEGLLDRCTRVVTSSGIVALDSSTKAALKKELIKYGTGRDTLRCLALAYRENPQTSSINLQAPEEFVRLEQDLVFAGIVGMLDPPREEVRASIETCRKAGIRVVVITGDNKDTAEAICRRIGVFSDNEDLKGRSYTGREFDDLSEKEQIEACKRASLFSRTEPSHKSRLVDILQGLGEIVAMTGDGVNDAPALKKADIGVAMGSGTAVAKNAAAMVLADDNFATIVSAVEEGRAIFNNTKQFIRYLISSNIGEVVCIFLTAITGMPEALIPVQLLWVNLVTDGLPATALGFNPPEKDVMLKKPRGTHDAIVNGWLFFRYLIVGIYVGLATVGGFMWWYMVYDQGPMITYDRLINFSKCDITQPAWEGVFHNDYDCSVFATNFRPSTVSLSILVTVEMFNAMNSVSENTSIFIMSPFQNVYLLAAIAGSFALHFMLLYIPFFAKLFAVAPINTAEWIAVVLFSIPVVAIDEVLKLISKLLKK